jgi:hypothetical protein
MALFVRDRIVAGWQSPGIDMANVDVNRNGRLDVGDIVGLLGGPGEPVDPGTTFLLGPGDAAGAGGTVSWVPIQLTPQQTAAAFSVEVQYDPDELSFVGVQAGGGSHLGYGHPVPGRVIVVGYTNPPAPLGSAPAMAYVLVRARSGLPASTQIPIVAVAGEVADAAGNLLPLVDLRSAVVTLETSLRDWHLYR